MSPGRQLEWTDDEMMYHIVTRLTQFTHFLATRAFARFVLLSMSGKPKSRRLFIGINKTCYRGWLSLVSK